MIMSKKEQVLTIFRDYKENKITEDTLIEKLNELHDKGVIDDADREVLGWIFIFQFRK